MNETADIEKQVSDYTAFAGDCELDSWLENSKAGFKVVVLLESREALDAFDTTMTRSNKRSGQHYQCVIHPVGDDGWEQRVTECFLWGRNWSEAKGASIALHFGHDDMSWWKAQKTSDQSSAGIPGFQFGLILMEYDDTGKIINQTLAKGHADRIRKQEEEGQLPDNKGGGKSKRAAMLYQDDDFQKWFIEESEWKQDYLDYKALRPSDKREEAIDSIVKAVCGFDSKRELDHSEEAAKKFSHHFYTPYMKARQE